MHFVAAFYKSTNYFDVILLNHCGVDFPFNTLFSSSPVSGGGGRGDSSLIDET